MVAPTLHQLASALRVSRLIDEIGNHCTAVSRAYYLAVTSGIHSPRSLKAGEALLAEVGLLEISDDYVRPSRELLRVTLLDDEEALISLAVLAGSSPIQAYNLVANPVRSSSVSAEKSHTFDPTYRKALGDAGEEHVVAECREQMAIHGCDNLTSSVQRVSLISDSLGYDIVAPKVKSGDRLLEVKTQGRQPDGIARFYLSRNEFEVGLVRGEWSLVMCVAPHGPKGPVSTIGWCRASDIKPYLPADAAGYWTEALVRLPLSTLNPGIPDLV